MSKGKREICVEVSPDVELFILKYLQATDAPDKLLAIVAAAGAPVLSKKAAGTLLAEKRRQGPFRSLREVADVPGVGAAKAQAMVDFFAGRVIDHELDEYRFGPAIKKALNDNLLLGKLMLLNPVRVLTEELGYFPTSAMSEKIYAAYAPAYRSKPAEHDAAYDRLRHTGQGFDFIKRLQFLTERPIHEKPKRPTADLVPPSAAGETADNATNGGFDVVMQVKEPGCTEYFKWVYQNNPMTTTAIHYGGEAHELRFRSPHNFRLVGGADPGYYFELPFSLDTKLDDPYFVFNHFLVGDFGVLLRPQIKWVDERPFLTVKTGVLRRIILSVNVDGARQSLPFDLDASGEAVRHDFNEIVRTKAPGAYQAMGRNPWKYFENLLAGKIVEVIGFVGIPLLRESTHWLTMIKKLQIKVSEVADISYLTIGLQIDVKARGWFSGWGLAYSSQNTPNIDLASLSFNPENSSNNLAIVLHQDLVKQMIDHAAFFVFNPYMWYELSGLDLIPGTLIYIDNPGLTAIRDGVMKFQFNAIINTENDYTIAQCEIGLKINGPIVDILWGESEEYASDPPDPGNLMHGIFHIFFYRLSQTLAIAAEEHIPTEQLETFRSDLLAAEGWVYKISHACKKFISLLELASRLSDTPLSDVAVKEIDIIPKPGELRLLGRLALPEFAWTNDDEYGLQIERGEWLPVQTASLPGRRPPTFISPAENRRLNEALRQIERSGFAERPAAIEHLQKAIGSITADGRYWHINLRGKPYNLIEPLALKWRFYATYPEEIGTPILGLRATVYTKRRAGDLRVSARLEAGDAFGREAVASVYLGDPPGRSDLDREGWRDYFNQLIDYLQMLGLKPLLTEGLGPTVLPPVDPKIERLIERFNAKKNLGE
ncbi:MAG TPA: hypothetical protein PK961_01490 [bacterium]|nr:hypothetical protein [bacterium]